MEAKKKKKKKKKEKKKKGKRRRRILPTLCFLGLLSSSALEADGNAHISNQHW